MKDFGDAQGAAGAGNQFRFGLARHGYFFFSLSFAFLPASLAG